MRPRGVFVTGTDTDVGKTWVAAGILCALREGSLRVAGMKPVSCGCRETASGPRNDDAVLLRDCSSNASLPYEAVNPYAFVPPVAPHLAAAAAGVEIRIPLIRSRLERLCAEAEFVVVEGAGGWQVPLNDGETVADLARALALPVVLVVGMRLGCLNHALLTSASIRAAGVPLCGWVANLVDPEARLVEENIDALRRRIPAPLIGVVPHLDGFAARVIGESLDTQALLRFPPG